MSLPIIRIPTATSRSEAERLADPARSPISELPRTRSKPLLNCFLMGLIALSVAPIDSLAAGERENTFHESPVTTGITHCPSGKPILALTFDDGPHPTLTPRLLDILQQAEAKATFYVIGSLVQRYPEIARRIVEEGHTIGNHTWTHRDLRKLSDAEIRRELQRTEDAIVKATGVSSFSMRPPYGGFNKRAGAAIPSNHRPVVMWSVDPQDWRKPGRANIVKRLVEGAHPGAILLCHDIHEETIAAIPDTLSQLAARGYKFVTVDEILTKRRTLDLDHDP